MAERVVAATHELTRTGAPLSLLHVLRWLRSHTDLEIEVVAGRLGDDGGQLRADFEAVVPTRLAPELFDPATSSPLLPAAPVLYLNSILAAGALSHLPTPRPYVIARVPELSMSFRRSLDEPVLARLLAEADRFVAVSGSVQRLLVERYGVDEGRIAIVPGSIDLTGVEPADESATRALRRSLGLPDDALVVGAAGTTDWRKGPDLFVRLAKAVQERVPDRPVHFVWIGGEAGGPAFWRVEQRLVPASVSERVHFLGSRPDPYSYYALMDVFALTSREDPFPRVCMEVAAVGVPIVTFDNGGAAELVGKGCGVVVPYLDVDAMADHVVALLGDRELHDRLGATGAEVVRRDHTVDVGGPATLAEIRRGLHPGSP